MTANAFRQTLSDDPASWSPADYETFENLAAIDVHQAVAAFAEALLLLTGATHQSGPHTAVRVAVTTLKGTPLGDRIVPLDTLTLVTPLIQSRTRAAVAERRARRTQTRRRALHLVTDHTPAA